MLRELTVAATFLCLTGCKLAESSVTERKVCEVLSDPAGLTGHDITISDATLLTNGLGMTAVGRHCKAKGGMSLDFDLLTPDAKKKFDSLFNTPPVLEERMLIQQDCEIRARVAYEKSRLPAVNLSVYDLTCGPRVEDHEFVIRSPIVSSGAK